MKNWKENQSFLNFKEIAEQFSPCMNDYLYVYDMEGDTYYIVESALERFRLPGALFHHVTENFKTFVYPDDLGMLLDDLQEVMDGEKTEHNLQYRWLGRDGMPLWINCKGRALLDENNRPSMMIGCINEIGKKQHADNVSGLLGEKSFREQMTPLHKMPKGYIMRIGIDDFKNINERFSMEYGDMILYDVAECIRQCANSGQAVYRIISDEFIIWDRNGGTDADAVKLYRDLRTSVDRLVAARNYEALYTISAGVVTDQYTKIADFEEVMRLSQFALSEAKRNGKNQFYVFERGAYQKFLLDRSFMVSLRKSVSHECAGFELFYQPIVEVGTGKLFAAEALLRFRNEQGKLISPLEFIPMLEESGLIIPVGRWILRTALEMCQEVRRKIPDFKVSINFSYVQLLKSPIFDEVMEVFQDMGLDYSCMIVELTESGHLEDTPAIQNIWRKLKLYGISIAVDDFGTGYSNLQNIGNLRPNIVKIDRSLTVKALQNIYEYKLLIHIIQMVHSIGLKLVIEGIETEEEKRKIAELEPDYIQGFYYSRPCEKEEFFKNFVDIT